VPVLGVLENMSGLLVGVAECRFVDSGSGADVTTATLAAIRAKCPELLGLKLSADAFPRSGAGPEGMAVAFDVPFLGSLPLDERLGHATDQGIPFVSSFPASPAARPLLAVAEALMARLKSPDPAGAAE